MLLQAGLNGNVQTEMLMHKDQDIFTFRQGWAFPRRIAFNGDECVIPPPDEYPELPNVAHTAKAPLFTTLYSLSLLIVLL